MGDLISRKELIRNVERNCDMQDLYLPVHFIDLVEEQPSVEPPKGEWIDVEEFYFDYKCSLCGGLSEFDTPFCQHCGAYMRKKV